MPILRQGEIWTGSFKDERGRRRFSGNGLLAVLRFAALRIWIPTGIDLEVSISHHMSKTMTLRMDWTVWTIHWKRRFEPWYSIQIFEDLLLYGMTKIEEATFDPFWLQSTRH